MKIKNLGFLGFENYEVDDQGNVWSLNYHQTGERRMLIPGIGACGYPLVNLWNNGKRKGFLVHQLVAKAFIPNPHNLPQVNHKDENKQNNNWTNLEWCDCRYNTNYGTRNERMSKKKSKKVNQYTLDGEFIKTYNSLKEASELIGINRQNITSCLIGKQRTSGGYIWRYKTP